MKKLIVFLSLFFVTGICGCRHDTPEFETTVLEYGEKVDFNDILKNKDMTVSVMEYDPYKLGNQDALLYFTQEDGKSFKAVGTFIVEDTTPPEIKLKSELVIAGPENLDKLIWGNVLSCYDAYDGKVTYQINENNPGTYVVSAKDSNGNYTAKRFNIFVLKDEEIKKDQANVNVSDDHENNIFVVEAATEVKNNEVNEKVSDNTEPVENVETSFVPTGKTISIKECSYNIPDSTSLEELSENERSFLNEVLYTLKNSNEDKVKVQTMLEDYTVPEASELIDRLNEECGFNISINSIAQCSEDGKTYAGTDKDFNRNTFVKVSVKPITTRNNLSHFLAKYDIVLKAINSAGLYNGMNEREAIDKINKWICNHMTYNSNGGDEYVGFETGQGSCHTYSCMFEAMCELVGIDCSYMTGDAGGYHAWNVVTIEDKKYYFDVCWNDNDAGDIDRYAWLSEKEMREDHYW